MRRTMNLSEKTMDLSEKKNNISCEKHEKREKNLAF